MGTSGERGTARDATSAALGIREELERSVDEEGFLPFDRFMELALYAPGLGYYERPVSPLGPAGDFYTAPQLHPIFGATLGHHIADMLATFEMESPLRIVELGPGDGELAASIIAEVARSRPRGPTIDYLLVERSDRRAERALLRAQTAAEGTHLRPRCVPGLGAEGPFEGAVVANEFWDAQPVRRLRCLGGRWEEVGVRLDGGRLVEAARPLPESGRPVDLPEGVEDGSVLEIAPGAEANVREVADHLVRGRALFLDYGAEQEEILRTHRFGTLTAIHGHRVLDTTIEHAGDVDLSTYVNFSRIRAAARRAGLEWLDERSQAEALVAWGLADVKARWESTVAPEEALRGHLAVKKLLFGFPQFRVVELGPRTTSVR